MITKSSGTILDGGRRPGGRGTGTTPRKRMSYPRLLPARRPDSGVGEWLAAMVRGLDALDFLERSRDLACEPVVAAPVRIKAEFMPRQPRSRVRL